MSASVPKSWLEMLELRRERDNANSELTRLQRDYDAVCAELQQTHTQGAGTHAASAAVADRAEITALREQVAGARAAVEALEQQLLDARQEKEDLAALSGIQAQLAREEGEKRIVDAERKERDAIARSTRAEEKVGELQCLLETVKQGLEAERDEACAGQVRAQAERDATLADAARRDAELVALRAELIEARQLASTYITKLPSVPVEANDGTVSQKPVQLPEPALGPPTDEEMDPNWLTPIPETPAITPKPVSADPQTEVIDLSMDSDDETIALVSSTRAKASSPSSAPVKSEPKASPAPLSSRSRNTSPGPGPSTSQSRAKRVKRSIEDVEDVGPPKSAKRPKKPLNTCPTPSFDFRTTKKLLDAVPPSLNQRVANMASIKLTHIPAHKLPIDANPTIGWVKRELFETKYRAWPMKMNNKLENVPDEYAHDLATTSDEGRHPALFVRLDMNPGLPTYPGQPGTLICSRPDVELGVPLLLVVASLKSTWHYVGQVILRRHKDAVPRKNGKPCLLFRNEWTKLLCKNSRFEAYQRLSMRVALAAEVKRLVTDEEVERRFKKYLAADKPKGMLPTKDQVLDAFDRGYATLDVLVVEPVSVNEPFYEEIWNLHTTGEYCKKGGESRQSKAAPKPKGKKIPSISASRGSSGSVADVPKPGAPASSSTSSAVRRSSRNARPSHGYAKQQWLQDTDGDVDEEEAADEESDSESYTDGADD